MLIDTISKDLHKLLEDCCLASIALLRKLCGVMVVTIDTAIVFVVGVLCAEHSRTDGACKVLDVVLSVKGGDVGAAKSAATGKA